MEKTLRILKATNSLTNLMLKKISLPLLFCFSIAVSACAQHGKDSLSLRVTNIVNSLRQEKILHLGYPVGIGGTPETNNKYYKLFRKLKAKATNRELQLLTYDSSKTIVLYSYLILRSRNYIDLKNVFLAHLNDTTDIWIAGGCTGVVDRVNSFMLEQLNPENVDNGKVYLTKNEYEDYLKLIMKTEIKY
jgi:hypothetical protein